MPLPYLERFGRSGTERVPLEENELSIGTVSDNQFVLEERGVSRIHAVLEKVGGGWAIRDLGSRNGTFVNGGRLAGSQVLRNGDEIRLGDALLVFRSTSIEHHSTEAAEPAPMLTPRERDVLRELCRPLASGDLFTEPASISQIAAELVVTDEAVKQHLRNLYAKFGLIDQSDRRRRIRLANEAVRRGAVGLGELRT